MTPDIGRIRAIKPAPHKQAGLGAVGWLLSILALGAVASLAGKLVPLYSDFSVMSNVLDGMAEEEGFAPYRRCFAWNHAQMPDSLHHRDGSKLSEAHSDLQHLYLTLQIRQKRLVDRNDQ